MKRFFPPVVPLFFLAAITVLLLSGCAPTDVTETKGTNIQGLPRPNQVLVSRFAFSANEVTPNQAITARMNNSMNNISPQTAEEEVGMSVSQAMQNSLAQDLSGCGIPAYATSFGVVPPVGTLVIEGELLTVSEGNSLRRFAVGLGAGESKVAANVSAYLVTPTGLVNVVQFYVDAKSSFKPGVGSMMAAPAATGGSFATTAAVSGGVDALTAKKQTAEGDAARASKQIAKRLVQLFQAEGWMTN